MESLTPFIRHELEDAPGPSGPPEETSSVVSPPLGAGPGQPPVTEPPKPGGGAPQPPSQPDGPDVQLLPPEVPQPRPDLRHPHDRWHLLPPVGRRTPPSFWRAAPGVMAQYGGGLFGAEQHLHSREPAPDEDQSGVLAGRVARRSALRLKEM